MPLNLMYVRKKGWDTGSLYNDRSDIEEVS